MKRCLFLLCLVYGNLYAQVQESVTPYSGMGGTDNALFSPWTIFSNPSGVARESNFAAGISYRHVLELPELGVKTLFTLLPTSVGAWGVAFSYSGYAQYNEKQIGLVYAKPLAKWLDVGLKINYLNVHVAKQRSNDHLFFFDVGMMFSLTEAIKVGLNTSNPFHIVRWNNAEHIDVPEIYAAGISWKADASFLLALKWEQVDRRHLFAGGVEFAYRDFLNVRTGFKTDHNRICAGVSICPSPIELSVTYNTGNVFGDAIGIAVAVTINKKDSKPVRHIRP
jgi:hypothetical protein